MVGLPRILYRRVILLYVLAIVLPALALLYLGIQSLDRQQQAVAALLRSNLRLSGDKLAAELERCVFKLAEACLREAETVPPSRAELEKIRRKHPVARHFFILEGDRVVYPPLHAPPPRTVEGLLARESPQVRLEYASSFREAETQELRHGQAKEALAGYRKAYELRVSERLKALALSRVARCLEKLSQTEEAVRAYGVLAQKHGDVTDLSYRPYALLAALAVEPSAEKKADLWRDVVSGRWELSAEQVDYFLARLGAPPEVSRGGYPALLRFALALEQEFRYHGSVHPDEVYPFAFSRDGTSYQTFYHPAAGGAGERVIGFAADLDWIRDQQVPLCRRHLRVAENVQPVLKGTRSPGADASGERVDFQVMFPFWELAVTPASEPGPAARQGGLLIQAGITILVLSLLLMGVLLLIRDVSRETRLNQLRADFVGAVSHELKTPLTLIRLYGETLLEDEGFSPEDRRGFHEIIVRETERLTQLIEKVLAFSKIERGEKQYQLQEGDLAPVVARTVEAYAQFLRRRGFSVEAWLTADLPPVRFDPDGVSQALVNLLDNAAKYSGENKFVSVRSYASDGAVALEVEDRGIGIPREEQERIFQRFYRVPDARVKGGYGLGLYLVRHIMDAHGGKIELESEPGRGSRFRLVFPAPKAC